MRQALIVILVIVVSLAASTLVWWQVGIADPQGVPNSPATSADAVRASSPPHASAPEGVEIAEILRLGIVPERNIYEHRRRCRALADYLEPRLHHPIELVTVNTYAAALQELEEKHIEAALLGSMVTKMAMDQLGAKVVLKSEMPGGASVYHGVMFVPEESPVKSVSDLAGKSIAYVKTTTAGDLFAACALKDAGLWGVPITPKLRPVGTHDDVIMEVISGHVTAGAVKNLRLDAWEASRHIKVRRLAEGMDVPDMALVVRGDMTALGQEMAPIMLTMNESDEGRQVLRSFGAARFVPCAASEYQNIDRMVEHMQGAWKYPER